MSGSVNFYSFYSLMVFFIVFLAGLVAARLSTTRIDLAISSDLKRARQTGEAIVAANNSVDELLEWDVVRERRVGRGLDLLAALLTVEQAVEDREYLTWRPPGGGESVVDLRNRAREFLRRRVSTRKYAIIYKTTRPT